MIDDTEKIRQLEQRIILLEQQVVYLMRMDAERAPFREQSQFQRPSDVQIAAIHLNNQTMTDEQAKRYCESQRIRFGE